MWWLCICQLVFNAVLNNSIPMVQAQRPAQSGRSWADGLLWESSNTPAILDHIHVVALSAKGLGELEYRSEGVLMNQSLNQSHHLCHRSKTTDPITVKHENNSTNGRLLQEIILLCGWRRVLRCEQTATQICSQRQMVACV